MKLAPAQMKTRMAAILIRTRTLLVRADSRMPRTRMTVEKHDDKEGGNVEPEVPAGLVEVVARQILKAGGEVGRRDPLHRWMKAEPVKQIDDMSDNPTLTLMLLKAYSRIKSQPMIQATSSPSVA